MQQINEFNNQLSRQRKTVTTLIVGLLGASFVSVLPLFSDSVKYSETIYCYEKKPCKPSTFKRGISYLVDRERRNQLFDNNVKIVKILPNEDPGAVLFGILSSGLLFGAYFASKALTDYQEKSIHSQLKLLKINALENDLLENIHMDLFNFSQQSQSEITKQAIVRRTQETIQAMKSEGELQLDHLNGTLQGELAVKQHQLQSSELTLATTKNQLEILELQRKIDKQNNQLPQAKITPNEQLKQSLIDALKNHEDGYLWTIINSLKPLWLIGNQGSGKTYTASAISLIRKYCLDADIYYLIDRHATGDNADVWKFLKPQNIAEIEGDITTAMQDCCLSWQQRIKQKSTTKNQVIVDEFTNLRNLIGDTADTFFKLSLTDTRKGKCYLLGVTHNDTNSSFAEGTKDTRKAGMTLIQKFSANGETPLPRVVVRYGLVDQAGNNLENVERTLPSWFHPAKIYDHFNGKPLDFEN